MRDLRRENRALTTQLMVRWIYQHHSSWYSAYVSRNGHSAHDSLARLCRRFAWANGFGRRRATSAKLAQVDMAEQQREFAAAFWEVYGSWPDAMIANVDETGLSCWTILKVMSRKQVNASSVKALSADCARYLPIPLDVSVMGPFKALLRTLWIMEEEVTNPSAAEKRARAVNKGVGTRTS
ncbi:hypothetical protein ACHHYP_20567 [Achlya hypogyna]|uniref:Uncharacterized protein n=1 Tax=Achlya hypogyna TaxID=1202772 RepID=A0A1V9ZHF2_ACHHY|nr:hypothetical protein ACHHYP_20567 [Achlya hypogyna]